MKVGDRSRRRSCGARQPYPTQSSLVASVTLKKKQRKRKEKKIDKTGRRIRSVSRNPSYLSYRMGMSLSILVFLCDCLPAEPEGVALRLLAAASSHRLGKLAEPVRSETMDGMLRWGLSVSTHPLASKPAQIDDDDDHHHHQ